MEQNVKELFGKVKNSAGLFAGRTEKAATAAGRRASGMMESTRLNLQIFDLRNEIDELYKDLGKMLYDTHLGIETDTEAMQEKLNLIDEKREQAAELRAKVKSYKQTVECPVCHKACGKNDLFCSGCGAQL